MRISSPQLTQHIGDRIQNAVAVALLQAPKILTAFRGSRQTGQQSRAARTRYARHAADAA
jgi:hypothetical protein